MGIVQAIIVRCCAPWSLFQGWQVSPSSIFCDGHLRTAKITRIHRSPWDSKEMSGHVLKTDQREI